MGSPPKNNLKGIVIDQRILRELLDYKPETGALTWRVRGREWFNSNRSWQVWNTRFPGKDAGGLKGGYIVVKLLGREYASHRLIWLMVTGSWPENLIDHENHKRDDNRWENLREATYAINGRNQSMRTSKSVSGVMGVFWDHQYGKWRAHIRAEGRKLHLGMFADKEDAAAARKAAESKYGYHPNHGSKAA